jgi:hypothetical protein
MRPIILIKIIILSLGIALCGVAVIHAEEPIPAKQSLVFPGVAPTPAAPVLPDAVTSLLPDQLYVVTSDRPFLLLASPARLVTITQEQGPIKIRATFADGTGKLETRTYAAKYVAIVEAASEGRVELIGVPAGVTDESEITRRLIDCGRAPQPPPDVDPEPEPVNKLATDLRAALTGPDAVKDAVQFAAIVRGIADQAEASPPATHKQFRALMTAMQTSLQWPAKKYPKLPDLWRSVIPTEPDDAKPITAVELTDIVANMRVLEKTAGMIAGGK